MSTTGPNIGIKHSWHRGYNGWNTENDANLRALDALVQSNVIAQQNAPPGSSADGDAFLVGTLPTGPWAGHANAFTRYNAAATAWEFWTPRPGWHTSVAGIRYEWNGTAWTTDLSIGGKLVVAGSDRILSDGTVLASNVYVSSLAQNAIPRVSNGSGLLAASGLTDDGTTITASRVFTGTTRVNLDGSAGVTRTFYFLSGGVMRWGMRANSTAESGSDVGSDFEITARHDNGTAIDVPVQILRAAGGPINLNRRLNLAAATTSAPSMNIPSGTAPSFPTEGDVWRDVNSVNIKGATKIDGLVTSTYGFVARSFTGIRVGLQFTAGSTITLNGEIAGDIIEAPASTITLGAGNGLGNSGLYVRVINTSSAAGSIVIPEGKVLYHNGTLYTNTTIPLPAYTAADLVYVYTNRWAW